MASGAKSQSMPLGLMRALKKRTLITVVKPAYRERWMGVSDGMIGFVKHGWSWWGVEVVEGIVVKNQVAYIIVTRELIAKLALHIMDHP